MSSWLRFSPASSSSSSSSSSFVRFLLYVFVLFAFFSPAFHLNIDGAGALGDLDGGHNGLSVSIRLVVRSGNKPMGRGEGGGTKQQKEEEKKRWLDHRSFFLFLSTLEFVLSTSRARLTRVSVCFFFSPLFFFFLFFSLGPERSDK